MPTALVSKSSKGIAAARSWEGWAAVWMMPAGFSSLTRSSTPWRSRMSSSWWRKFGQSLDQPLLVPAGVPLGAEEDRALVVVDAVDGKPEVVKEGGHLGADQTGGAGDEYFGVSWLHSKFLSM